MSQAEATARAQTLRESLLDHGVAKVSIELVRGRPAGPNDGWWTNTFVATLGHHIVSRRSQGLTPFLHLVKVGRTDLPGPICNGYGGFDQVARIISMGWANHPGRGGPVEVEAGTIPENNGRPYLFGWEFEGGLDLDDWPDSMRAFMGACHAGTLDWLGRSEKSHHEHKTWAPGRKSDRLGYDLVTARAEAARYLDDMAALTDRQMKMIVDMDYWLAKIGSDGTYVRWLVPWFKRLSGLTPEQLAELEESDEVEALEQRIDELIAAGGGVVPAHDHRATIRLT